jgi:hypothetical protein
MGAIHDKSTPAKFHFGNAMVDLDHLIPRSDETDFVAFSSHNHNASLENEMRLSAISAQLNELARAQEQLSFALRDIKRSIG